MEAVVYVDELRIWKHGRTETSHLTADSVEELRAFARILQIPERAWHRGSKVPHYDLNATWRAKVLAAGAVFVPAREQARARMALRRATPSA